MSNYTYLHQLPRPSLVQIMACCLNTTPSYGPMLAFSCLPPYEQFLIKFECNSLSSLKEIPMILSSAEWLLFCFCLNMLNHSKQFLLCFSVCANTSLFPCISISNRNIQIQEKKCCQFRRRISRQFHFQPI